MTTSEALDMLCTGDYEIYESLDGLKELFAGLPQKKPSLEEALREANIPDHDTILKDSKEFADVAREDPEIAKLVDSGMLELMESEAADPIADAVEEFCK